MGPARGRKLICVIPIHDEWFPAEGGCVARIPVWSQLSRFISLIVSNLSWFLGSFITIMAKIVCWQPICNDNGPIYYSIYFYKSGRAQPRGDFRPTESAIQGRDQGTPPEGGSANLVFDTKLSFLKKKCFKFLLFLLLEKSFKNKISILLIFISLSHTEAFKNL